MKEKNPINLINYLGLLCSSSPAGGSDVTEDNFGSYKIYFDTYFINYVVYNGHNYEGQISKHLLEFENSVCDIVALFRNNTDRGLLASGS